MDGFYEMLRSPKCRPDIGGGGFVDDLIFWLLQLWHGLCAGLAGGCHRCRADALKAAEGEQFVDALLDELHLERSDKDIHVGQLGLFLGVWVDSHKGRLLLTEAKYAKLLTDLRLVLTWERA